MQHNFRKPTKEEREKLGQHVGQEIVIDLIHWGKKRIRLKTLSEVSENGIGYDGEYTPFDPFAGGPKLPRNTSGVLKIMSMEAEVLYEA